MSYLLEGLNAGTIITIVVIFVLSSLLRRSTLVPLLKVLEKRAARGAAAQAHQAAAAERMASAKREAQALLAQAERVTRGHAKAGRRSRSTAATAPHRAGRGNARRSTR